MTDTIIDQPVTPTLVKRTVHHAFAGVMELCFRPEQFGFSWQRPFSYSCHIQDAPDSWHLTLCQWPTVTDGEIRYTFTTPEHGRLVLSGEVPRRLVHDRAGIPSS